jgi:membrane protein implicated in regulation of membrane protease activity
MDIFSNVTVIWFVIGFICLLLEFVVPGFIIFFFGIGAWIVAGLTLMSDISVNTQLLVFLATSILTALLFRNWVKSKLGMREHGSGMLDDEIIGKSATAQTSFTPGKRGKVYFKGTIWEAYASEPVSEGDELVIVGNNSIILTVSKK